jgi:TetR/AcrR family transcriptional repressor of nem operon
MKAITPRQQDRRDRILEITRQQVAQLGYDGVNMRELAVEADVSTATLYNLFNSKDELILAASEALLVGIAEQVEGRGVQRLINQLEATADVIISHPNYADAMGRMLFAAEASAPVVKMMIDNSRRGYETVLRQMQADGELVDGVYIDKLARNLAGVIWSVNLLWMKGFIALHDFREEYVGMLISYLLPWLTEDTKADYLGRSWLIR